jgi:ADP-ribose pyrophosphatase YjhB (NUDIX family)
VNFSEVMAQDGQDFLIRDPAGQDALVAWYPPDQGEPGGKMHGSAGVCFTDGQVVLVREEDKPWGWPGGRPEGNETWRQTLQREVMEEACAVVEDAILLGFTRGTYINGPEQGLVLVRAFWLATVSLLCWTPAHEIAERTLVSPEDALERISPPGGWLPISRRLLHEATLHRRA